MPPEPGFGLGGCDIARNVPGDCLVHPPSQLVQPDHRHLENAPPGEPRRRRPENCLLGTASRQRREGIAEGIHRFDLAEEPQGHMPLRAGGPSESSDLGAWKASNEADDLVGRPNRDEEAHTILSKIAPVSTGIYE